MLGSKILKCFGIFQYMYVDKYDKYVDKYDHTDPPPYLVSKRKSVGQDGVILTPCGQSRGIRMLGRGVGNTPMEAIITPFPQATFDKT